MYQKWLEAFHHVATEGSFTGAARVLNVGQPTISSHVSNLEGRFGVELFHRKGRTILLTPVGQLLYDITHDLYGHEQEAIAFLKRRQDARIRRAEIQRCRPLRRDGASGRVA